MHREVWDNPSDLDDMLADIFIYDPAKSSVRGVVAHFSVCH